MSKDSNDPVQLKLRFNEALRRQIETAAKISQRSMNREIIYRLQRSFKRQQAKASA